MRQQFQRVALARQVILRALQYQRAALASLAGAQFIDIHPGGAQDAGVQGATGLVPGQAAAKAKAQVDDVLARVVPTVNADQEFWAEMVRGFFQGLADNALNQRFIGFQVAGWLVEQLAVSGIFLDQQKFAVLLDDSGNGNMGFPDCHALNFIRPG